MNIPSFIVANALLALASGSSAVAANNAVEVSSLAELANAAKANRQEVTMKPGLYRIIDYIPLSAIRDRRNNEEFQFLTFSGNDNVFDFTGVTIELDTALRSALHPPIHTDELLISGNNNVIKGLTVKHVGQGISHGGAALGISGEGTTLKDCTIEVCGSSPYGYGDLFGKGGYKKSGVHIVGSRTTVVGCRLVMRSFGHGFYIQEDANAVHFENCRVEGVLRTTDEMLAENSGFGFDRQFRTDFKNRQGEFRITPGYMKALSEDAFRTYGQHQDLTLKNCTAVNMRGGFELRTRTGPVLDNCTAIGCERGFWISNDAKLVHCRGDAQYGPLLFAEGDNAQVEVELLPTESKSTVHVVATIYGNGNRVTVKESEKGARKHPIPILIGFSTPIMGEGSAPIPQRNARRISLVNETSMPVEIGEKADNCEIAGRGPVLVNHGNQNMLKTFNDKRE